MAPSTSLVTHADGLMSLDQLPLGRTAAVVRMDDAEHVLMIRLKTMGMHEGRAVRMLRTGSRVMVQCAGTRIGLSAEVARRILVKPISPAPEATRR